MRFCPFCSAETADELAVCQACGRRLPPLPPRRRNALPTGVQLPPRTSTGQSAPLPRRTGTTLPPSPGHTPAPAPITGTSTALPPTTTYPGVPAGTGTPGGPGATNDRPTTTYAAALAGSSVTTATRDALPTTTYPGIGGMPILPADAELPTTRGGAGPGSTPDPEGRRALLSALSPGPAAGRREAPPPEPRGGDQAARRRSDQSVPPPLGRPTPTGMAAAAPPTPSPDRGTPSPDRGRSSLPPGLVDRAGRAPIEPEPGGSVTLMTPPPLDALLGNTALGAGARVAPHGDAHPPRGLFDDDLNTVQAAPSFGSTTMPSVTPAPERTSAVSASTTHPGHASGPGIPAAPAPHVATAPMPAPAFGAGVPAAPVLPAGAPTRPSRSGRLSNPLIVAATSPQRSSGITPPPTRTTRPGELADRPFTPPKVHPVPEIPEPGLYNSARYSLRFARARYQRRGAIKTLGGEIKQDTEALDQVLGALGKMARMIGIEGRVFSAENGAITDAEARIGTLSKDLGEVDARKGDENSKFVEVERERNIKLGEAERLVDEASKELANLEGQRRALRDNRKSLERRQKTYLKSAEENDRQAGTSQMGETRAELRRSAEQHRKEAAAIEPERQECDRRLAGLERPIGEATARLDAAKAELDAAKRSLADVREGHTHRLAELDAEQKRKAREIGLAESEIARRLVTLGTLLNLNRVDDPQFDELYQRIDRLRGAINARTTEIEKLTAEREAYDRGVLVRGIVVMGGAIVAFIALIVILRAIL